jgi:ABC-type dipeptide/oligopeptide/nickel transport system permease subunit
MALPTPIATDAPLQPSARKPSAGYLFGIPLGELGWFTTLLMSVASGFLSFFAATFLGIVGLLFANTALHHTLDYSISYRLVGLPVGLLVLVLALIYLGSLWIRRMLRRS